MANVGPLELGVVLLIALIVFGPKRLPELGQSLGRGMREFKNSLSGENEGSDRSEEPAALVSSKPPESVQDGPGSQALTTKKTT
jgi:sec-independent protein translocase protein TatA